MIKKLSLILAVISTASISIVSAQQTEKVTSSGIGYLEYLPPGYHSNSNKYPVVISLHGVKEKGTSSTDRQKVLADLNRVDNVGLPKYVKYGTRYPFILISPQLKNNQGSWPPSYIIQVLNYVKKYLRIDERRVYLTGLSLGGLGVWKTAGEYPEVFAAIAPICPGGNALNKAHEIAAHNVAAWGFHGDNDRVVSYTVTTKMINAMNSAPKKPNPLAKATIFRGLGHIIWDKAYQQTNVLDWMLSHRKGSAPPPDSHDDRDEKENDADKGEKESANKAPSVNAGPDRTLVLPANSIYVEGDADDADGKISSYKWTKISGGSASMSGTTSTRLRAYNLKEGNYVFRLTVRDDDGATRSDDMRLTVKSDRKDNNEKEEEPDDKKSSHNDRPSAYAGPDLELTLPTNSVTINGKASDKDGKIVSYEWAKSYGRRASFSGANSSTVRIYNLERGVYIFRLRVKDNDGAVRDDYFKITVHGSGSKSSSNSGNNKSSGTSHSSGSTNKSNMKPRANAGPDRVLKLPDNSITIQAEASDKDGKIVSYDWAKTYGRRARFSGEETSRVRIYDLQEGVYIFKVSVRDDDGALDDDYFKITVED